MKEKNNNEELIDKFIHDHLDEEESKVFKDKFENEPGFQDAVLQQMEAITALKTVKEFQNVIAMRKNTTRRMRFFLAAASVAVIAVSCIWLFYNNNNSDHELLFANYFTPFQIEKTRHIQDSSEQLFSLWKKFVDFYANKNFEEGILTLHEFLDIQPHDDIALFFLGQCFLNIDETDKAIFPFRKVLENRESAYYNDALWFLSLAYLKVGDISQCKKLLVEISSMEGFYKEQAISLMKEVENQ